MLRPKSSLLGSSRRAVRQKVRAERKRALSNAAKGATSVASGTLSGIIQLAILCALPFLYLAAAYLALDLPARWLSGRERATWKTLLAFFASVLLGLIGLARAMQEAPPLAPVRPQFARAMFWLSWLAGLLMTIGDLVSD